MAAVNYLGYAQQLNSLNPVGDMLDQLKADRLQQQQLDRQGRLDALSAESHGLQNQQARMTLADMTRKQTEAEGLRAALATPRTVTTQTANPEFAAYQGRLSNIQGPVAPYQNFDGTPNTGTAPVNPTPEWLEAQKVYGETPPAATVEKKEPMSLTQKTLEYAKETGNQELWQKTVDKAMSEAANFITLTGNPKAGVDYMNSITGSNLQYLGTKDNLIHVKEGESIIAYDPVNKTKSVLVQGTPKPDAEALLDKRLAAQAANTDKQIAAADARAQRTAGNKQSPVDAIVAREAVKDLPKLRKDANMANASKTRLDQMITLMDKGSAAGLKGNLLQSVSGIFDTPATSEAELFKKLASAGAGQLRSTVIGPGQVSNYEQKLLQSVSGGGNGARSAVRELLLFYKQEADRTIGNYNEAAENAALVAPAVSKAFKPIGGITANTATSNIPRIGETKGGYKFKGGDPANPSSWQKVGG